MPTEYEKEFNEVKPEFLSSLLNADRRRLIDKYSWAIPNDEAIARLVESGPLVEGGAGKGYWAHLIRQAGGDILAYDQSPPENAWTEVLVGSDQEMKQHQDRTLFLCWPPYSTSMGYYHILAHAGKRVIYVGEGPYGCTGDDQMHWLLDKEFRMTGSVRIPNWSGIQDWMMVFERI